MLSSVSSAWITICPQPIGGRQEAGGVDVIVDVGVLLGVGDFSPRVGVNVGIGVLVAVSGMGDGIGLSDAAVGVTCGTNSTSEMDSAPTINPMDIKATVRALPMPRNP